LLGDRWRHSVREPISGEDDGDDSEADDVNLHSEVEHHPATTTTATAADTEWCCPGW